MTESKGLVLVVGASGHLGFKALRIALEHGYAVRAVVRNEAKAQTIKETAKSLKVPGHLELIQVPDFTTPGAFNLAIHGVDYVVNCFGPLPTVVDIGSPAEAIDEAIFKPTVNGTLNLLESAKEASTVKRIVITTSALSIQPISVWTEPTDTVHGPESRLEEISPPFSHPMVAYAAAKIAVLNRCEAWVEKNQPGFDVIYTMPTFILGRDDLVRSTEELFQGSNVFAIAPALGFEVPMSPTRTNNIVSVEDCALVHIIALDKSKVAGNQSFVISNTGVDGMRWDQTNEIVKRRFPREVASGIFPTNGPVSTIVCKMDPSKTESVFGIKLKSYEDCVVSVCEQYLELLEKENGQSNGAR